MARQLDQAVKKCKHCAKKTLHIRNGKRMSWLLHILLSVITLGVWLFVVVALFIWHLLTSPIGGWTCQECGK